MNNRIIGHFFWIILPLALHMFIFVNVGKFTSCSQTWMKNSTRTFIVQLEILTKLFKLTWITLCMSFTIASLKNIMCVCVCVCVWARARASMCVCAVCLFSLPSNCALATYI